MILRDKSFHLILFVELFVEADDQNNSYAMRSSIGCLQILKYRCWADFLDYPPNLAVLERVDAKLQKSVWTSKL